MEAQTHPPTWKTLLAFAIIYFVWGSTFLAIRIGVREVPPFLLAAMRFLVAGLAIYAWIIARGARSPSGRQWMSALLLALLIFVGDYGFGTTVTVAGLWILPTSAVIVLVGLKMGVFTPTEAAVVTTVYAFLLGLWYGELHVTDLPRILTDALALLGAPARPGEVIEREYGR